MKTSNWSRYEGRGRIVLAKPPPMVPRGYRIITPSALYIRDPRVRPALATIWATLALADAGAIWRGLHLLVYPFEPVILSGAPSGEPSYRTILASWLATHLHEDIPELDAPETYEAVKQRKPPLHGLGTNIWPAETIDAA